MELFGIWLASKIPAQLELEFSQSELRADSRLHKAELIGEKRPRASVCEEQEQASGCDQQVGERQIYSCTWVDKVAFYVNWCGAALKPFCISERLGVAWFQCRPIALR